MIKVVILGITGSIGQTSLRGISQFRDKITIVGASCHSRIKEALADCLEYSIPNLCITGPAVISSTEDVRICKSIKDLIDLSNPDIVLNGIASGEGLLASLDVIRSGKTLALANKESVVMGGNLLFEEAKKYSSKIIPVDSEHSAIDELILTNKKENIDKLVITASGGPFLRKSLSELDDIKPEVAVKHPTWKMGPKISIDSSTLANKGLEVIEAHYLFGFDSDHIEVVVHPQSIVHSMVRTLSGQVYAQLSPPDMVFPIMRSILGYEIDKNVGNSLSFDFLDLHFEKLDFARFPFVADAFECVKQEGVYPTVFNIADEIAVDAFCKGKIKYTDIQRVVHKALEEDYVTAIKSLDDIPKLVDEIKKKVII